MTTEEKVKILDSVLAGAGSAVIACSGGTDSMFLLHHASGINNLRLMAVTVSSPYMFTAEAERAVELCRERSVEHRIVTLEIPEEIRDNPEERCYLCKKRIISAIAIIAREGNYRCILDGTNADDLDDYRPGMKALKEEGVISPLLEAGLTKKEIRELSHKAGLATWDMPANACLLTRFPHGTIISEEELRKAEKAETFLASLGLAGSRVRIHGDIVRIECREGQMEKAVSEGSRLQITSFFRSLGFKYITIDLEGYITGRMNKNSSNI